MIDTGFGINTFMQFTDTFTDFSVTPGSGYNGYTTWYTFEFGTSITIISGDVYLITFPPQIRLPSNPGDLQITSIGRDYNGIVVYDILLADIIG